MSKLKVEAFLDSSKCSDDLCELLSKIEEEFQEQVEVMLYRDDDRLREEYNLTAAPALIIEEMIRMIGFCPSKETLLSALRDVGLE
jgi:hypothetical protein